MLPHKWRYYVAHRVPLRDRWNSDDKRLARDGEQNSAPGNVVTLPLPRPTTLVGISCRMLENDQRV